jgi:hypothetical protein
MRTAIAMGAYRRNAFRRVATTADSAAGLTSIRSTPEAISLDIGNNQGGL